MVNKQDDNVFKVVLLGSASLGKANLTGKLNNKIIGNPKLPYAGFEHCTYLVRLDHLLGRADIKLSIYDYASD